MTDLRALSYADRRALVNGLVELRRRPWRALVWAFWLLLIAGFAWLRTRPSAVGRPPSLGAIAIADVWVCGFVVAFGVLLAAGGGRLAGFFGSRAEALLLVRAPLAPPLVATYLQARAVASLLARTFARFAYIVLIALPTHVTPLGLLRELGLVAAATVALASVILPRALARGTARALYVIAGCALVLGALVPLLRDALLGLVPTPAALALAARLPGWHPGLVFDAVARGDIVPVRATLLIALLCGLVFVRAARDAYPELYAFSLAHLEFRARFTARRVRATDAPSGKLANLAGGRVPAIRITGARTALRGIGARFRGAGAFVWLDALQWSRRASPLVSALVAVVSLAAGVGLGLFARASGTHAATLAILTVLPNGMITLASTAGLRLAGDLRRPLFWLGEIGLAMRLAGWTYAPLWRDGLVLGLAALGFGLLTADIVRTLTLLVTALALAVLTRAVGVAVFALFPSALDQRGPAVFLRLVVAYVLVAPAAAGAVLVGLLTRSLLAGSAAAFVLAAIEAGGLLAFAAWRLAGRVDALTNA